MALFGKKKTSEDEAGDASDAGAPDNAGAGGAPAPDPAKAAKFFDRAKAVHDSSQFEYAATLWLQGLRQDPTSMGGLEGFFQSAQAYAAEEKRDKPSKDQSKNFGGREPIERYLGALLSWGVRPSDVGLGVRVLDAAEKLGLHEPGYWIGERVLAMALREPKTKKDAYVKLMESLRGLQVFDLALKAGEAALSLDRSDAHLDGEVRNLGAQMAMSRGGYERTGQQGGFRANIRDLEAQRRLEEETRLVKSEEAIDRVLDAARIDYESRPTDRNAIAKYARALQERGRPEDEKAAFDLLAKGYKETQEFRFRQAAGDLRLRVARRKVAELKRAADAKPDDAAMQEELRRANEKFAAMEVEEFELRSKHNPTDLGMKFELGVRYFNLGDDEKAIALFQESQNDPKSRSKSLNYLGRSFERMGWVDEAADTLRRALEALETQNDDFGLEVRYNLMVALARKAADQRDLAVAEEAYKIGSGIAIQQISYRDIRAKRDELQQLVRDLRTQKT